MKYFSEKEKKLEIALDKLKKLKPRIVFNALHGKYGEDGFVQSMLEALKISYTINNNFYLITI